MNNEEKKTNGTDNQQTEKAKKKVNVKKLAKTAGKVVVSVLLIGGGILIGKGGSKGSGSEDDGADTSAETSED